MSYQYFNHSHPLLSLRLDEGEEFTCKARDRLIADEQTLYGCIACKYYLHERCFNLPRWIKNPSHPSHTLTLLPSPTYASGGFSCNACGSDANSFSMSCAECEFDLHLHCSSLPTAVLLDAHPHELKLIFESPYVDEEINFVCDVCGSAADRHHWVYYCAECDFGTHLDCATAAGEKPGVEEPTGGESKSDEANNPFKQVADEMMENQLQMMRLQNQMNRTRMFTQIDREMEVKHFSHKHPLCHAKVKEEDGFICSGCEGGLSGGSAYKCTISDDCDFLLHDSCFKLTPLIQHKSHPHHPLTLLPTPPYDGFGFTCEACLYFGHAFVYHCAACQFDLHIGCASLSETVKRDDHEHPLVLKFSAYVGEDKIFICDVCRGEVPESCWVYYCQGCDYGTHLDCITAEANPEEKEEEKEEGEEGAEYSVAEVESRLKLLQLRMQLAQQNSQNIIDAGRMLSRLAG